MRNIAGIEWSAQFCADPAEVDVLRQNARRLYARYPEAVAELGIRKLLDTTSTCGSPQARGTRWRSCQSGGAVRGTVASGSCMPCPPSRPRLSASGQRASCPGFWPRNHRVAEEAFAEQHVKLAEGTVDPPDPLTAASLPGRPRPRRGRG
jgi:Family of unknown function (DUF6424)